MSHYERYKTLESRYDIAPPADRDGDLDQYWQEIHDAAREERDRLERLAERYAESTGIGLRLLRAAPVDPAFAARAEAYDDVVEHVADRRL